MSILDQILTETHVRVAGAKREISISTLEERVSLLPRPRPLDKALRKSDRTSVIAECKQASPSEGVIRENYDAAEIARGYESHGAAAISVLTEPDHFGGSIEDLAAVRSAVELPVLRKDFIVDPYQLLEARAFGADAVLLIAAALDPTQLRDLHQQGRELGLSVLVETHDERELETLDLDEIEILGINHRDLKTFEIDLSVSERIFPMLPAHIVRVAESGIRGASDMHRLVDAGADAFLIGTSFMRSPSPGIALSELLDAVTLDAIS